MDVLTGSCNVVMIIAGLTGLTIAQKLTPLAAMAGYAAMHPAKTGTVVVKAVKSTVSTLLFVFFCIDIPACLASAK